jgi:hypothetical protein
MKNIIAAVIVVVLSSAMVFAQSGYKKKVVSYVNTVVVSPSAGLSTTQKEYISTTLSRSVQMERFGYAALPPATVERFAGEVSGISGTSSEQVRAIVERTLAPDLVTLLDINKELLSKQNLSEAERNTFLATKAQAAGLSASQLESILNSGFFYVPFVEHYARNTRRGERDIKNDEGKVVRKQKFTTYEHEMKIGLLWFKLNVDRANNASIAFVGAAKGWSSSPISRSEDQDDGEDGNADWEAFSSAVDVSAVNVGTATKRFDEFQLTGGVTEVTTFGVRLNLGTREGVGIDDSYWIEEMVEDEDGNVSKERRGFVKIRRVGNNRQDESAHSYAQTITGTNYSPGLTVKEIPMIGINAVFGLASLPVNIAPFDNRTTLFSLDKHDFAVNVTSEVKNAFGPFVWFQGNIANGTNVSELWLQGGAAIGFLSIDGKFYLPEYNSIGVRTGTDSLNDIGASVSGYVNIGILKKYYFRRFGLVLQADLKYWMTYLSATGKDREDNDLTYVLSQDAFGMDAKLGLEMYITPMLSIGGGAEYNIFPTTNSWSATVTDKDNNDTKNRNAVGPDTKYSGLGFYLWFNYALPSLF